MIPSVIFWSIIEIALGVIFLPVWHHLSDGRTSEGYSFELEGQSCGKKAKGGVASGTFLFVLDVEEGKEQDCFLG